MAAQQVADGHAILVLKAQSSVAAWPPGGVASPHTHTHPPTHPRLPLALFLGETSSSGRAHTASWRIRRCHLCHHY